MRRRWYAVLVPIVGLLVGATPVTAQEQGDGGLDYVALGDSFTSGPFIPLPKGEPVGCARSTRNYPSMLAERLDVAEFTDVSCGGATTEELTQPQDVLFGTNPPQFEALESDTDLVTITIGGNDIGFADIITTCARESFTDPIGNPCEEQTGDDYPERIDEVASEITDALEGIRERSPDATVVLISYLRILPNRNGCFPVVPIARGDVPYLDGLQEQLTGVLADQAAQNDAVFADAYGISQGHDVCALPTEKWVEGFLPTRPAFPVHPNASGMRAVAELTERELTAAS